MSSDEPMQAITFRLPPVVIEKLEEISELAASCADQPIVLADVYRWAFDRWLDELAIGVDPRGSLTESVQRLLEPCELELTSAPTKTVCVHVPPDVRRRFDDRLEQQRVVSMTVPALARSVTVSMLYAAAVGALLRTLGVVVKGWN